MRNLIAILLALMCVVAHATFTPRSRLLMLRQCKAAPGTQAAMVDAVVIVNNSDDITRLADYGAKVMVVAGNVATVRSTLNQLYDIEAGIECTISFPRRVAMANDSSRIFSHHPIVSHPEATPYTGKGVVYGTLDVGIDFNHPSFCDATGNTRIVKAYLPDDSSGVSPTLDGVELPGSEYTREQIENLTADTVDYSHGTHTMGTAVGSYFGNNYYGYAPEADIIAVGSRNLTDVNIMNSIAYVFDQATQLNQPAVVSLSLSSYLGPHNSRDLLARYIDNVVGEGRIVLLAAGNTGHQKIHIEHTFAQQDTLRTVVWDNRWRKDFATEIDLWGDDDTPFEVQLAIIDASGEALYSAECTSSSPEVVVESVGDPTFASLFMGSIAMAAGCVEGQWTVSLAVEGELTDYDNTQLALWVTASRGKRLNVWSDGGSYFAKMGRNGYTAGTSRGTISSMACGNHSISVGSYNSRMSVTNVLGEEGVSLVSYDKTPQDISYFSSWGPDAQGVSRPDVTAPGRLVVSGFSIYDSRATEPNGSWRKWVVDEQLVNGRKALWGIEQGTSMATPAVAGIVATWLQAHPRLTPQDIKNVLKATAVCDQWVLSSPERWGAGKIDSQAGLQEVLRLAAVDGVSVSTVLRYDSRTKMLLCSTAGIVKVYSSNGTLIEVSQSPETSLTHLPKGVYIATCNGVAIKIAI